MGTLPLRLAVLLSGSGTTLQNLIEHVEAGTLDARIVVVLASRPDAYGLERATQHGLEAVCIPRRAYRDAEAYHRELHAALDRYAPDLIALAGYLHLFRLAPQYRGRVMNIHPSLLPAFCGQGLYGLRVHQAVLEYGVKLTGCTVHFADEAYDQGPIILQRAVPVLEDDTPQSLARRVFEEECQAYPAAIRLFAQGRLRIEGRKVRILDPYAMAWHCARHAGQDPRGIDGRPLRREHHRIASRKPFPARNFGVLLAGMKISRPVCGLRPFRAARDITEKVPNPTSVTLSPLLSAFWTPSMRAFKAFSAWCLVISASSAILATRSALFIGASFPSSQEASPDAGLTQRRESARCRGTCG
jgi:formyltetrahydrofolate-dependent phosphoribosylglycinamide formyltransferase